MNELQTYRQLQKKADDYRDKHKIIIEKQEHDEAASEIRKTMPKLLDTCSIWCRKHKVCIEATHCDLLKCEYKDNPKDVVNGCAECQDFQITTKSDSWGPAKHIFGYAEVSQWQGR
jgi:hypothetical protein